MPNISLFKATKDKKIQFDKFQMQKQPTVPVYLVEAGFTAAVGEQTNLHLPTNGRAEAIMDTIYENGFAI